MTEGAAMAAIGPLTVICGVVVGAGGGDGVWCLCVFCLCRGRENRYIF